MYDLFVEGAPSSGLCRNTGGFGANTFLFRTIIPATEAHINDQLKSMSTSCTLTTSRKIALAYIDGITCLNATSRAQSEIFQSVMRTCVECQADVCAVASRHVPFPVRVRQVHQCDFYRATQIRSTCCEKWPPKVMLTRSLVAELSLPRDHLVVRGSTCAMSDAASNIRLER